MKQLIHATLKSTWGVAKPKRHNVPLKMAIPAYKRRFFPVLLNYLQLPVATMQVQRGEHLGAC